MQKRPTTPRRMTRQQYEALQRQRRQNRIAIAIMAGIAVLIVVAVILILKPRDVPDAVTAMVDANSPIGRDLRTRRRASCDYLLEPVAQPACRNARP